MSEQFRAKNGFRKNLFQYVLIGVLSMGMVSLPGCFSSGEEAAGTTGNTGNSGNGSTGGGSAEPDVGASSDAKMVLLADNLQLPSGDSGSVRITANLKDSNNVLMTGEAVTFKASSGSLQPLRDAQGHLVTDNLGNAVAILSSSGNAIPRTITVTAVGGGSSSSIKIDVTGTTLEVSGPSSAIAFNQSTELTIKLKAGDGSVLAIKDIKVSSDLKNRLSHNGLDLVDSTITTNDQGEARVTITDSKGKNDKIILTALDGKVSTKFDLFVSPNSLIFNEPAKNTEIPLGSSARSVKVKLVVDGAAKVSENVDFSISRGKFANGLLSDSATTDDLGVATVSVSSLNAGGATITASTATEEATLGVEFVATEAAALTLEAAPKQVSLEQTSTLTATVRDDTLNLVKNKKVLFNLTDITGGTLSKGQVVTNSLGRASTVYTAGVQASGEGQVEVKAVVDDKPTVFKIETLTVDPQNVRIIFGTGNLMFEPTPSQYRIPYVIQVSDDGGPVAGVGVDVRVYPTGYYKGEYELADKVGRFSDEMVAEEEFKPTRWRARYSVTEKVAPEANSNGMCIAEDANRNGILDPNEPDHNGDLSVTPPAVVTVGGSPGQTPTVSKSKVTTDDNGFGYFSIYYPQNFANWVEVEIVAQTTQAGRESTFTQRARPIAIASDVNKIDVSPPAPNGSPFGTGISCTNDL